MEVETINLITASNLAHELNERYGWRWNRHYLAAYLFGDSYGERLWYYYYGNSENDDDTLDEKELLICLTLRELLPQYEEEGIYIDFGR